MHIDCPHCSKELRVSEAVSVSLQRLPSGKSLKVQCIHCKQSFTLDGNRISGEASVAGENGRLSAVRPPAPPDISWLFRGELSVTQKKQGVLRALLVVPEKELRDVLFGEIGKLGYHIEEAATADEALEMIAHNSYRMVVCHSSHDKGGFAVSAFHRYLCRMPMVKRRLLFYVLVGPEMKTLYELQALACSANLVVNDAEVKYIGNFLQKALADHQRFMEPFLSAFHHLEK